MTVSSQNQASRITATLPGGSPPLSAEPGAEGGRDNVLLVLLGFLNVASLLTTTYGAMQLLPAPICYIVGVSIQAMLFTMLAGFAGQHAPIRRWFVVAVFSVACVYASFFTYYGELSKGEDANRQHALAEAKHAELVKDVFAAHKSEAARQVETAKALLEQAQSEIQLGSVSGQRGYGDRGRKMMEEANAAHLAAEQFAADVRRLEPMFEYDLVNLTPKEVHSRDLAAWQNAPTEWTQGYAQPVYEAYVDETSRVQFLAPFYRVREGDTVALVALGLASLVDGMAILLGSAIERRHSRRRSLEEASEELATYIHSARKGAGFLWQAIIGRLPLDDSGRGGAGPQTVLLMIHGDPAEFIQTVVDAVHPENGHIPAAGLRFHPNASFAGAWDQLFAAARLAGWVRVDSADQYVRDWHQFVGWLVGEQTEVRAGEAGVRITVPARRSPE